MFLFKNSFGLRASLPVMLRWRDRESDMVEELPKDDGAFSLLQLPKELYEKVGDLRVESCNRASL